MESSPFLAHFSIQKKSGPGPKKMPLPDCKNKNWEFKPQKQTPFWVIEAVDLFGMMINTWPFGKVILQGIHISHLGKRKIIFKIPFWGDMLVPWRVYILRDLQGFFYGTKNLDHGDLAVKSPVISGSDSPKVWNSCRSLSRCAWKFDPLHGNSRSSMLFGNHDGSMGSKGTFT